MALVTGDTFGRADAGEQATDLVRAEMTPDGLARHRADLDLARDAFDEFAGAAVPAFAAELGIPTAELERRISVNYPAVASILDADERDEAFRFADGIVSNLELHQRDFEDADAIPVGGLPMTTGAWVGAGLAVGLVVSGLWGLLRPGVVPLAVALVLGVSAVVGPFAVAFPQKADAADRLLDTLNVTPAIAADTRALLDGARASSEELEEEFLPDLAAALSLSSGELDAEIASRFPALARGRAEFDDALARYDVRVAIREAGVGIVPEAKKFPLQAVTWWSVVPGVFTTVACAIGIAGLVRARKG